MAVSYKQAECSPLQPFRARAASGKTGNGGYFRCWTPSAWQTAEQESVRAADQSKSVSALCQQVDLGAPVPLEFYLCQEAEPGAPNDLGGAQERRIAKLLKQYNQENPQQVFTYFKHMLQA